MTSSSVVDMALIEKMHQSLPLGIDIGFSEKMHQYELLKDKLSPIPFSLDEIDLEMFPRCASKTNTNENTNNKSKQMCRRNSDPFPSAVHFRRSKSLNRLKEDQRGVSLRVGNMASRNGIGKRKSINRTKSQRYLLLCDPDRSLSIKNDDIKDQAGHSLKQQQRRCTLRQTPVLPESKIFLQLQIPSPVSSTERTNSMSSDDDSVSPNHFEAKYLKQQKHPRIVVERYPRPSPLLPLEDPVLHPNRGECDDEDDASIDHLSDSPTSGHAKHNRKDEKKKLARLSFIPRKFKNNNKRRSINNLKSMIKSTKTTFMY